MNQSREENSASPMTKEERKATLHRARRAGYLASQGVGTDDGLNFQLFECDGAGWSILFSTAHLSCLVHVTEWPDLVALLGQLSVITLAAARDVGGLARERRRPS